ncbi:hypothetical protein DUNSADRAFT_8581 [Dunaliella salina]|uniref:Encoded protein n=1 Tax=Dunaliella salina TaxID=3046 RepID=A0ABQ7GJ81_DUNSA|nr:hypothetical protein DUNSADRAFT_8581 [Dunaliella salina]|eukprot:KAF5834657.1 hypothetical protein DUNSADRAFT_8581 [Dunaliella salina]
MIHDDEVQEITQALPNSLSQLAQCLSAAAPTVKVTVDRLEYIGDDWAAAVQPFFWSVCSILGIYATRLNFLSSEISVADMIKLKAHCPNVKGIHFFDCCFEELPACLSVAAEGLQYLEALELNYCPAFDPGDHASYLRGFGYDVLSVCASVSPNRRNVLNWRVNLQTPRQEECIHAARNELRSMCMAWNRFCRRLEFEGAHQQIFLEVLLNGSQL